MSDHEKTSFTISGAAELLGVSRWSVRRMVKRGLITYYRYPDGGTRIERADLDAFKARCRRPAIAAAPAEPRHPTRAEARAAADQFVWKAKRLALQKLGRVR